MSKFDGSINNLHNATLAFSPPDRTSIFLSTVSSLNRNDPRIFLIS